MVDLRVPSSLLVLLAGVGLAIAVPATAQEEVSPAACEDPVRLVPESLESVDAMLRRLPSLDAEVDAPDRTWSTAASLGRTPLCGEAPWLDGWTTDAALVTSGLRALPAHARLTGTTAWPVERANGLQWTGKGLSGTLRGGVSYRSGALTLELRPELAFAENRPYAVYDTLLVDRDRYAYPWHARRIDWPQRHGDESLVWLGPGESRLALDLGALELALSSEQVVWGPSLAYPLLLGPSAPGVPHLSLSTLRGLRLGGLGTLRGQLLWGLLDESDHFDDDGDNDRRLLSGIVVSFRPSVFPGFSVGAASLVHSDASDLQAGDLFAFLQTPTEGEDSEGNVSGNGLGSLFAHWAVPGSGFEAWVEWGRDDYSFDTNDLLSEPDHTQAWSAGVQQVARWGADGLVRFSGELTHLTNEEPRIQDDSPRSRNASFYTHAFLRQGHTHRGQLLGSPVGPGSDAQRVALDLLQAGRLWGLSLERVRWDDDAYVRSLSPVGGSDGHDVELTLGLRHARPLGALRLHLEADAQLRRNRLWADFSQQADAEGVEPGFGWARNLRVEAAVSWMPGRR